MEKQQQARETLKLMGGCMNARSTCGGLSASPTDATKTRSCGSLWFFNVSAVFNLTLFTATLQLFCKHTNPQAYCGGFVIPHPAPNPGQPM